MRHIPTLADLERDLNDMELSLDEPLETETYNEVLYMMTLLGRANEAIAASKRALAARKVQIDPRPFITAENALEACYGLITPIILAHAVARNAGVASK